MVRIPGVNCLAQVQSLVKELRSCKLHSVAKKEKEKKEKKNGRKKECHLLISNFFNVAAAAAKSLQLYPTLCDPRDGNPLGSY